MERRFYNTIVENPASFRIGIASALMLSIFIIGTIGYHLIEGMSFFDGLYMTFITISTIGFAEIKSLTIEGRIFTMAIFIFGIGIISYIASQTTQLLFESELFLRRAMNKRLEKMDQHYIICGYGRIGHRIAQVLTDAQLPMVIVENRDSSIRRVEDDKHVYVKGDAQDENVLREAGITKAKALICTLSSDQDNVFTTLLAREMNNDLYILVRANENKNRNRILRAGADKVISPYDVGADRMANVILRPNVEQFIETMTRGDEQDHTFDEVLVSEGSQLANKSLAEINVSNLFEVLIIAIIPSGGRIKFNPKSSDVIQSGDSLVLLGDIRKIQAFRSEMCNDNRSLAERAEQIEKADNN
ncbi:MAG TPA: potassium channel protein [Balneolaceae bacterium]|nr:potassium channel protein [Balneolaceae bacterium]|tara:strand:- start:58797 stop:59873 length:1077 start_codon:yes stop_codon:yes gene_type:complete